MCIQIMAPPKAVFPLTWHLERSSIECYGWVQESTTAPMETVLLRITDFSPYLYLALDPTVVWTERSVQSLIGTIQTQFDVRPMKHRLVQAHGIYSNARRERGTYLYLSFYNDFVRRKFNRQLRDAKYTIARPEWGNKPLIFRPCEDKASAVLQMTCIRGISTSDWFAVPATVKWADSAQKSSTCDKEATVSWKLLTPVANPAERTVPSPLIMSYDIETYGHDLHTFCNSKHPRDVVFQISCVFGRQGEPNESWESHLLSLGNPDPEIMGSHIHLHCYSSERALLLGYRALVQAKKPQLLIGYNTFKFDNPYMMERARYARVADDFSQQGCVPNQQCREISISWSSSAFQNQEIVFLDTPGRIHMDVMMAVQRKFNLDSYSLNAVASRFLKAKKDPLTHIDIHNFYEQGIRERCSGALALVGNYCVKDSALVLELFDKLQLWYSSLSMAQICHVTIADLFVHGEQFKIFAQVYKYCSRNGMVVENNSRITLKEEKCQGAYVLDAIPGVYENVVSFDFASLYPSIIVSHNIDYSTLVMPDENIPDSDCHVIEWEEHVNCEHLTALQKPREGRTCQSYRYRWLKEPAGVLPTIIQRLLMERKRVKAEMKAFPGDSLDYILRDQQQAALKVSANSMYGALATTTGNLVFLPGGMCITAVGRRSIRKVTEFIERDYFGKVIYGDTDSNYVVFPRVSIEELYDWCIQVAKEISKHFPPPMKLEFEDKIYAHYLLLTKKRYIYQALGKTELESKGVLLKRRDTAPIIRQVYSRMVELVLSGAAFEEMLGEFMNQCTLLLSASPGIQQYSLTKSVKTIDEFPLTPAPRMDKIRYGCYIVPRVSNDPELREKQFKKKAVRNEEEFYRSSLPGHVQLALRMKTRGQPINNGARLGFLYSKRGGPKGNATDKMEELEYFSLLYQAHFIDTAYYLSLVCKCVQELFLCRFGATYKDPDTQRWFDITQFFSKLPKIGVQRAQVMDELRAIFSTRVEMDATPKERHALNDIRRYSSS